MSGVSQWLLSITGVILLSVLAEFVLPEGQINKYTKVIFSFVVLLVVIMPLPKLFGKDIDISHFFSSGESVLQENYLEQTNLNKLSAINKDLNASLESFGFENVEVSINANIFASQLEIYWIEVDLTNAKYKDKTKDIAWLKMQINEIIDEFAILKNVEVRFDG